MRTGTCTSVLGGDTILLDGGKVRLRYSNVWSPGPSTDLGDAALAYNTTLVLGRQVQYQPNGHVHWDGQSIIADVYLDGRWINQTLRDWFASRTQVSRWVDGVPVPGSVSPESSANAEAVP